MHIVSKVSTNTALILSHIYILSVQRPIRILLWMRVNNFRYVYVWLLLLSILLLSMLSLSSIVISIYIFVEHYCCYSLVFALFQRNLSRYTFDSLNLNKIYHQKREKKITNSNSLHRETNKCEQYSIENLWGKKSWLVCIEHLKVNGVWLLVLRYSRTIKDFLSCCQTLLFLYFKCFIYYLTESDCAIFPNDTLKRPENI